MCGEVRAPAREKSHAHVAELVDALVSGTSIGNDVEVRVLSCALLNTVEIEVRIKRFLQRWHRPTPDHGR